MRLFIGTLYTIENEFEECLQSIKQQSYGNSNHFVYRNLPNKKAHITLFNSFLGMADEYDVLIKVDADMVLFHASLFEEIVNKLKMNSWAEILSIAVHDFFSDRLIWGLNAYRNSVRWDFKKETLFVDRPDVPNNKYLFDDKELAPAAFHCKNPSPYQAFHYGVHRGLKVIQPGKMEQSEASSKMHWNLLERTHGNFQKTKDIRIGLACLGAELTFRGRFIVEDLDYSNPHIQQVLNKYVMMNFKRLSEELRKLRFLNFDFFSPERRRKIIRYLYR